MQAILFDREDVVVGAQQVLEWTGVADRCQIVGGNFFDAVLPDGDLYLISRGLVNWDDTHAIKIITNCYQAMTVKDRLVVVDFMLPKCKMLSFMGTIGLNLFILGGSFMRTEDEFYNLLSSAGFKVTNTIKTTGPVSAIEAKPA